MDQHRDSVAPGRRAGKDSRSPRALRAKTTASIYFAAGSWTACDSSPLWELGGVGGVTFHAACRGLPPRLRRSRPESGKGFPQSQGASRENYGATSFRRLGLDSARASWPDRRIDAPMAERVLERKLGLIPLLAVSVGGIIGSAWLFAPLYAAQLAGPGAILSWFISGGVALLLALVYAELGASFPVAGGLARFSYFSHGNLAGFVAGFACWLGYVAIAPIEVQAMIRYMADSQTWLLHQDGSQTLTLPGIAVASVLLFGMSYVNLLGVQWFGECNKWITLWKILIPVSIPIALIFTSFRTENFVEFGGFLPGGMEGVFAAVSTGGTLFAMLGFRTAIELAGEAKNPGRDLPRAVIGSVLITSTIYLFIQIGFLGAVSADALVGGWSKLSSAMGSGPFVELAAAAGLIWLVRLIYIDSLVSPGGCGLVFTGTAARLTYAMAANGQLPKFFQKLNKRSVPAIALWINFGVGLVFFAPSQTWQSIVSFICSIQILSLAFGPLALPMLRQVAPGVARPFRLPRAGLLCPLAFFAANAMIYWCGWETNRVTVGLLCGAGLLFVVVKWWRGARESLDLAGVRWMFPYAVGLLVISYLGNFGGARGLLPSGWDLGVVALFSILIYLLALQAKSARVDEEVLGIASTAQE
jgi:amino acid transporter